MTCYWPPLLDLDRQPLFVPFGKLQSFNYLLPPFYNRLLNPSLVITLRYSVPIVCLLLYEAYNEACSEKGYLSGKYQGMVKNIHLTDLADTLCAEG